MSDEAAQFAAIKALLPDLPIYDYGRVPGMKNAAGTTNPGATPDVYGLLSIERRYIPQEGTRIGRTQRLGYRVALRIVARSASECRVAAKRSSDTIDGTSLSLVGRKSTPLHHETSTPPEIDDGWYSALHQWTYAL
ncbi:hypothetical protein [Microbacterium sp.]|uniref:hypothetical protein n=1 Tax=Microbacterium sp. TaxID=51671 RepID=UPI0037359C4F